MLYVELKTLGPPRFVRHQLTSGQTDAKFERTGRVVEDQITDVLQGNSPPPKIIKTFSSSYEMSEPADQSYSTSKDTDTIFQV